MFLTSERPFSRGSWEVARRVVQCLAAVSLRGGSCEVPTTHRRHILVPTRPLRKLARAALRPSSPQVVEIISGF